MVENLEEEGSMQIMFHIQRCAKKYIFGYFHF